MTDKQIIIDGIDVSRCNHKGNGEGNKCNAHSNKVFDFECCDFHNCYYKQLKRKEQECEELKNELHKNFEEKDTLHLIIDRLLEASGYDTNTATAEDFEDVYEHMRYEQQQLDQLKAENDELKEEQNKKRDHYFIISNENARLQDEKARLGYKLNSEIQKLKQTLTEIEELLLKTAMDSRERCVNAKSVILQKISEVQNVENN